MNAGEQVGVDRVMGRVVGQRLLVGLVGIGLDSGDKARAHVGHVGTERERGCNAPAVGDCARQQDGALEPLLHFTHQREGRQRSGMTARAGADQNEAINTLLRRLARVLHVDHVVEHDAAIRMRCIDNLGRRAQRGDDDRNLVLHAGFHVLHQAIVGGVADLVDCVGRDLLVRVQRLVFAEFVLDLRQPFAELLDRPRVQRRERTDDAGLALRDDKFGARHNKERRPENGQFKRTGERSWKRHQIFLR